MKENLALIKYSPRASVEITHSLRAPTYLRMVQSSNVLFSPIGL